MLFQYCENSLIAFRSAPNSWMLILFTRIAMNAGWNNVPQNRITTLFQREEMIQRKFSVTAAIGASIREYSTNIRPILSAKFMYGSLGFSYGFHNTSCHYAFRSLARSFITSGLSRFVFWGFSHFCKVNPFSFPFFFARLFGYFFFMGGSISSFILRVGSFSPTRCHVAIFAAAPVSRGSMFIPEEIIREFKFFFTDGAYLSHGYILP